MFKQLFLSACIASCTLPLLTGCTDSHPTEESAHYRTIIEAAQKSPELSLLVEALVQADLVSVLSSNSQFTVFAPTNDAFVNLLGTLNLTKDELFANKTLLSEVLKYHVIKDAVVKKEDIPFGSLIQTIHGGAFSINTDAVITDAQQNSSNIVATDVMADNGVIHIIDSVLLPVTDKTVVDIAQSNPDFSILVEAVVKAELASTLANTKNLTVFAPTNDAFVDLLSELGMTKEALFSDKALLTKVLTYHVVAEPIYSNKLPTKALSLQGQPFSFSGTQITDAKDRISNITTTDIQAVNGVVHVVDTVLLPK